MRSEAQNERRVLAVAHIPGLDVFPNAIVSNTGVQKLLYRAAHVSKRYFSTSASL